MEKEIIDFLSIYKNEIKCSFIIGSYVYTNDFKDIDIIVISDKLFCQKIKTVNNIQIKVTFLTIEMLNKDLENNYYGSFIYGRFLNPIRTIKNAELVNRYQKEAISREFSYYQNIIKDEKEDDRIIKNFILNRGLYFNKYLKNLKVIKNRENESIKTFCKIIEECYNNMNFENKVNTRDANDIINYWRTRFSSKGLQINLNDIIKLNNFELGEDFFIKGDDI